MLPAHRARYEMLVGKLYEWRDRYPASVYPEKVVTNIFYKLTALELLWEAVAPRLPVDSVTVPSDALSSWGARRTNLENAFDSMHQPALPRVKDNMYRRGEVAGVRYEDLEPDIRKAASGDRTALAEIECRYLFHGLTAHLALDWLAARQCGLNGEHAYAEVAQMVFGGCRYGTLPDVMEALNRAASVMFFGTDLGGGLQGGCYQPLPPRQ